MIIKVNNIEGTVTIGGQTALAASCASALNSVFGNWRSFYSFQVNADGTSPSEPTKHYVRAMGLNVGLDLKVAPTSIAPMITGHLEWSEAVADWQAEQDAILQEKRDQWLITAQLETASRQKNMLFSPLGSVTQTYRVRALQADLDALTASLSLSLSVGHDVNLVWPSSGPDFDPVSLPTQALLSELVVAMQAHVGAYYVSQVSFEAEINASTSEEALFAIDFNAPARWPAQPAVLDG